MEVKYLFDLALILLSTKLLGMLTRRIQMPQVVGALLAGLILGPACFGVLTETEFINNIAELGVIVLMFNAGLETDVKELKKSGFASFVIALFGVLIPIAGGFGIAAMFNNGADSQTLLQNIFVGIILTATSVSITVETLKELGKLSTKTGNAILGAALIDDVLGIIALTVITSFADSSVSLTLIFVKIIGFFAFCGILAIVFMKFVRPWMNKYKKDLRRFSVLSFVFCLLMAFGAEKLFGISDITGAFVAGLLISGTRKTPYIIGKFETVSFMLLSPVFFASVGLKVSISSMSGTILIFTLLLFIVAVLSKVVGCGLGAKFMRYTNLQAAKIGVGMISRGEVALIVATKGAALGLMVPEFFAPIIIMVVATTIITPILLKVMYKYQENHPELLEPALNTALVERHQEKSEIEYITQEAVRLHGDIEDAKEKKENNKDK